MVAETIRQDAALIEGIAAYRRHDWQRTLIDPPSIWSEGGTRLLDYGGAQGGRPVLFVPSLINRAYVLDLAEGNSMLRWLARHGVRPLLLDWGWPAETERRFTLTDYVAGRMERAMTAAAHAAGEPPVLAGYCMGGTLAVAAAQRRPDLISGLALLAAPWDFHAPDPERAIQAAQTLPLLEPALAFSHALSVDLLQSLFALLDPWGVADKYRGFARLPQDSAARPAVRRPGGLAERRYPPRRRGRPHLPGRVVRAERPGPRPVADRRTAGRSHRDRPADLRRHPRPRPHRAARIRPAARPSHPGRGAAPAGRRPHRHGRRRPSRGIAVAPAAGLASDAGNLTLCGSAGVMPKQNKHLTVESRKGAVP